MKGIFRAIRHQRSVWLAVMLVSAGLTGRAALEGLKFTSISGSEAVTADWRGRETRIETGQSVGQWSLMAVVHRGAHGVRALPSRDTNGYA